MQAVDVDYCVSWISPVLPVTMSGISQLHQTLLSFFKGTHISKLVVSFQKHDSLTRSVPAALTVAFHWWAQRVASVSRVVDVRLCSRDLVISSGHNFSTPRARALVRVFTKHCVYLFDRVVSSVAGSRSCAPLGKDLPLGQCKALFMVPHEIKKIKTSHSTKYRWRAGAMDWSPKSTVYGISTKPPKLLLDLFVMATSILLGLSLPVQGAYTAEVGLRSAVVPLV